MELSESGGSRPSRFSVSAPIESVIQIGLVIGGIFDWNACPSRLGKMKTPACSHVLLAMGTLLCGCSERRESPPVSSLKNASTPAAVIAGGPSPDPRATPDPAATQRAQVAAKVEAKVEALPDSECDYLVLEFQLIPRDEILEPLSKPKKDLLRWVRRIASAEELATLERAKKEADAPGDRVVARKEISPALV